MRWNEISFFQFIVLFVALHRTVVVVVIIVGEHSMLIFYITSKRLRLTACTKKFIKMQSYKEKMNKKKKEKKNVSDSIERPIKKKYKNCVLGCILPYCSDLWENSLREMHIYLQNRLATPA